MPLSQTALTLTQAQELDEKARKSYHALGNAWVQFGLDCLAVNTSRAWEQLGYSDFKAWWVHRGYAHSTVYDAMTTVDKLTGKGLPYSVITTLSRGNAKQLVKLPESKLHHPAMIEAAQTMEENKFEAVVQSQLVGAEVEIMVRRIWKLPETLAALVDEAIKIAKFIEATDSTEVAIERIISEFLETHRYEYEAVIGGQHGKTSH